MKNIFDEKIFSIHYEKQWKIFWWKKSIPKIKIMIFWPSNLVKFSGIRVRTQLVIPATRYCSTVVWWIRIQSIFSNLKLMWDRGRGVTISAVGVLQAEGVGMGNRKFIACGRRNLKQSTNFRQSKPWIAWYIGFRRSHPRQRSRSTRNRVVLL